MTHQRTTASSPLARLLPGAQFGEHHHGIVDAPREAVWEAVHQVRWADLRLARPLLLVRGVSHLAAGRPAMDTFAQVGLTHVCPPETSLFVMIGKPWQPRPASLRPDTLDEVRSFDEPGWLKYGMEWLLHPLADGRTLLETRTLCEATDARARHRFLAYWALIRSGSGLVRRELIDAIDRRARG